MKRVFLVVSIALMAKASYAHDFEVGGIYYNINSDGTTVTVTYDSGKAQTETISVKTQHEESTPNKYSGDIVIPPAVEYDGNNYTVTAIGNLAFSSCPDLTSITIPNTVVNIKMGAFTGCKGLTSLKIPDSVTAIGGYMCQSCSNLQSVSIGKSVTTLGVSIFSECTNLASIDWNVKDCGDFSSTSASPFYNLKGITVFNFGNEVEHIPAYLCYGLTNLTSLTIPKSVTEVGLHAFGDCSGLTSIVVEQGNEKYDSRDNCNAIVKIATNELVAGCKYTDIPNSVTTIGPYAFEGCGMKSITLPPFITEIEEAAFAKCTSLETVNWNIKNHPDFPPNVGSPFAGSTGITTFNFGEDVESIPSKLCYGLKGLTSLTIPASVTKIGYMAFNYCTSLETVNWNVKSMGDFSESNVSPFKGMTGIAAFNFGDEVERIPAYLCDGLTGLSSLTISKSVSEIGLHAFGGCPNITSIVVEQDNTNYDSRDNCNAVVETSTNTIVVGGKNTIIPNTITAIGAYAFERCNLSSITIPPSITSFGASAFAGCSNLKAVHWNIKNFPDNIAPAAMPFADLTGITAFYFGDEVERIPAYLCYGLTGLSSIVIPNTVTEIGDGAFSYSGLNSVFLGNSVKKIGSHTFYRCSNLKSALIGDAVEEIGSAAFSDCSKLLTLTIPNTVTKICSYTFSNCKNLSIVTLSDSLKTIEEYAFNGCSGLSFITIPESVSEIGKYAFNGCLGLTTVTWNAKNCGSPTDYFYAPFFGLTNIKNLNFGNEVESVPSYLCNGLTGLTSLTIPASVTTIGDSAFRNCTKLTSVTNLAETPQEIQPSVFENVDKTACKLFVLSQSLEKYKAAAVWKDFLVEAGVEGVEADAEAKTVEGYYNLQGVRIDNPERGQVSIVRYADGTAKKVVIK